MSIPTTSANDALNGLNFDTLSLHTDFPGVTGANEVTGGAPAYARKSVVVASASGGQRVTVAGVTFDVPALTVRWIGAYLGSVFRFAMPNGGSTPQNFMADPATSIVHATAHGYASGAKVVFFDGTPPGGLTEGLIYYVRDVTANNFKVAATSGGTAITLTSGSSFGCVMATITEQVYTGQDTHQVLAVTEAVPN